MSDPRRLSLSVLDRLEAENKTLDRILDDIGAQRAALSIPDRRLFNRLVFGVLRWRGRLDWIIAFFFKAPLKAGISPGVKRASTGCIPDHLSVQSAGCRCGQYLCGIGQIGGSPLGDPICERGIAPHRQRPYLHSISPARPGPRCRRFRGKIVSPMVDPPVVGSHGY